MSLSPCVCVCVCVCVRGFVCARDMLRRCVHMAYCRRTCTGQSVSSKPQNKKHVRQGELICNRICLRGHVSVGECLRVAFSVDVCA
jgi:hypothetical protein